MLKKKTKLELTWIGKENRPKLEPRILIEDPEKSYHAAQRHSENDLFDNKLIFGDNLLALKALEQEYAGKVKCIFIDPPYNTGSAFAQYDDGIEHSLWLALMRDRIELLYRLLSEDGTLWITIDDNECHYLKVMCDEVFGRVNFIANVIWLKKHTRANDARWFSDNHDHILIFAKNKTEWRPRLLPRTPEMDSRFKNPDNDPRGPWSSQPLQVKTPSENCIYEIVTPSGKRVWPPKGRSWQFSEKRYHEMVADNRIWFGKEGKNVPRIKKFLSDVQEGLVPTTFWPHSEVGHNQDAKSEVKKLFPDTSFDTPKPERLMERIIALSTESGDLILDSFAGSGTTGAVAHKMGRRWIMVELEDTCHTHIIPRMTKVIDGEDDGGITKSVNWQGGGGFRYFRLGPSLIIEDEWGNPVINKEFNSAMLAEAMCKLEGFEYAPSDETYWIHGKSTETDFIYVTTQFMSKEMLTKISDEVGPERSLLICCSAFRCNPSQFPNLTLKKIPKAVLKKCEWGHDDYSLEIKNLPDAPPEHEESTEEAVEKPGRKFGKDNKAQTSLFETGGDK